MLILYWQIGITIVTQKKAQKWGSKVIDQLAKDLRSEFGTMKGFSRRNLEYMASFAENYPNLLVTKEDKQVLHQAGAKLQSEYFINDKLIAFLNIPWRHIVEIITKA